MAELMAADPAVSQVVAVSRTRPAEWADDVRRSWIPADILDESSLAAAALRIAELGTPTRIVVATGRLHGEMLTPEKSLRAVTLDGLTESFAINAAGPILAAKHLLPLAPRDRRHVFAALSARVGSIGDNRLGGWYGYRAGKAALNMLIRNVAIEHRRTHPSGICVALHPGTVDTTLSRPFQGGVAPDRLFSPDHAAACLLAVIDGLDPAASGGFYAWDGTAIDW